MSDPGDEPRVRRFGERTPEEAIEAMRDRHGEVADEQPELAALRDAEPRKPVVVTPPIVPGVITPIAQPSGSYLSHLSASGGSAEVPIPPEKKPFRFWPHVIAGWAAAAVVAIVLTTGGSGSDDAPDDPSPGGSGKATCQERLDAAINNSGLSEDDRVAQIELINRECGTG